MDIFNVFTMLGGLALFLYGMNTMGDGLAKVSGGKLESIIEKLTSNKIKAVCLGAIVTAIIQSSSATTVMVVGFVNSGIMKLSQAIGIIMGANIGTTMTSWILSLSGIESDMFIMKMLKPSAFAPLLALLGVILISFCKKEKKKDIGMILVGFGILMVGMDTMSNAVKPLANVPEFTSLFTAFSNPILGVIVGALLTAIIQSSSASIGILQALCATGAVTYAAAVPIILGQNIGTCITAILSGLGGNKNAKRTSLVHLYFNIIGVAVFMVVFYAINAFIHFEFISEVAGAAGVAAIHSIFNIAATLVLLPFTKLIEKMAYLTIPEDEAVEENDEFQALDVRFLDSPAFAISQCKHLTVKMAEHSKEALFMAAELCDEYDEKKADEVERLENLIDKYEDELSAYLVKISNKNILEQDSRTLSMLLHVIGDFERISDHAINVMEGAKELNEKKLAFSPQARAELNIYTKAIRDIMNIALQVFEDEDQKLALTVEPLEEVIDNLNEKLKRRHISRLRQGECTIERGCIFADLQTNFERIADHCSNVAVDIIQLNSQDEFDVHDYINELKSEDNEDFMERYRSYKSQYVLPKKDQYLSIPTVQVANC